MVAALAVAALRRCSPLSPQQLRALLGLAMLGCAFKAATQPTGHQSFGVDYRVRYVVYSNHPTSWQSVLAFESQRVLVTCASRKINEFKLK